MGKTVKNIAVILGLATVAVAGYYMYTQQGTAVLQPSTDSASLERMLANTRVFIQHRQELDAISLDVNLFEDERFTSLRSYTQPILEQPVGRENPFAPAEPPVFPSLNSVNQTNTTNF